MRRLDGSVRTYEDAERRRLHTVAVEDEEENSEDPTRPYHIFDFAEPDITLCGIPVSQVRGCPTFPVCTICEREARARGLVVQFFPPPR